MPDSKELYDYAKDIQAAEVERFRHLEEKAATYLTVFGFLLTASGVMIGVVFDHFVPPHGCLQSSMVGIVFCLGAGLVISGLFVFWAIRPTRLAGPQLTDDAVQQLKGKDDAYINQSLTKTLKQLADLNESIIEKKAIALKRSYWAILITTGLLVLFGLLVFIQKWNSG
ncbi:MAG TPA: hypothetical protein VNG71_12665 [Pyrinomonadaceae bacterium]|nr:hypothetical protein [Pyrinomonadaceae bacterium]